LNKTLCILFFLSVFVGCRKEDEEAPVLLVDQIDGVSSLSYFDFVRVYGNVSDNEELSWVRMEVFDENLNTSGISTTGSLQGAAASFDLTIHLNDKRMPSGNYFLKISCSDKSGNQDSQWLEFYYTELPWALEGVYAVNVNSNSFDVLELDVLQSSSSVVATQMGNFEDLECNGFQECIFIAKSSENNVVALEPIIHSETGNYFSNPSNDLTFNRLAPSEDGKNVWVSTEEGRIIKLNQQSSAVRTINLNKNLPEELIETQNYLGVTFSQNNQNELRVYNQSSGTLISTKSWTNPIKKIFEINENEWLVISQASSGVQLDKLQVDSGTKILLQEISGEVLNDAVSNDGQALFALSNGLYGYNFLNGQLTLYNSGIFNLVRFDKVSNQIYAVAGSQVKVLNVFGTEQAHMQLSSLIADIELLYNK